MSRRNRPSNHIQPLESRVLFSTLTVNVAGGAQYTNLQTAISAANAGDTILVSPGTYTAGPLNFLGNQSLFFISKALNIVSTGGAGSTVLAAPSGQPAAVQIVTSNVTLQGFTVTGGSFGVQVEDYVTLQSQGKVAPVSNVLLKNLTVSPEIVTNGGHGVLLEDAFSSVVENVHVTNASANGIYIHTGGTNVVMGCTVDATATQHAFAIGSSNGNQLVDNTVNGSAFDGIILVAASNNVVRGNTITNPKYDGITVTDDGTSHTAHSTGNVIVDNVINNTGLANGLSDGTGIFLNSESDYTYVAGNVMHGAPENGIAIFNSSYNTIDGNTAYGNGQGGIFVYNNPTTSLSVGGAPTSNLLENNYFYDNLNNAGFNLRGAVNTTVTHNYVSGTGITTGLYGGINVQTSSGTTIYGNTLQDLQQGFDVFADSTTTTIYDNRAINVKYEYGFAPTSTTWDAGRRLGGNFWSNQSPAADGSPSQGTTPYTDIVYNPANGSTGGGNVDSYPFQTEALGQAYAVTVLQPTAGTVLTSGARREVRWSSTGSARVTITYASASTSTSGTIASDIPDTGVYIWQVPAGLPSASDYVISITPETSAKAVAGTAATSSPLTVVASGSTTIQLATQARSQRLSPGATEMIGWTGTNLGAVAVQIQLDGGAWTTLGTAPAGTDFLSVTLPSANSSQARFRVVDASGATDVMDGFFTLGTTAAVTQSPPASVAVGSYQNLTWVSPAASVTATISLVDTANGGSTALLTAAPDVGTATVQIPDDVTTAAVVRIAFFDASGNALGTVDSTSLAVTGATLTSAFNVSISGLTFKAGTYQRTQTLPVSATVACTGTASSTAPTVSFYLSTTPSITPSSVLLGTGTGTAIAAGGTQVVTLSPAASVANLPGGTFYIGAVVSATGESTTTDDTYFYPAAAIGIPGAVTTTTDLGVTSVTGAPGAYTTLQAVTAIANITNAGTVPVGGTVKFYLSTSSTLGGAGDVLIGTVKAPTLKAGASAAVKLTNASLAGLTAGTYYLGATITAAGDSNAANNSAVVTTGTYAITVPTLDLAAVSLTAKRPKTVIGAALAKESATAVFVNDGQAPITGTTDVSFYYSTSSTFDGTAVKITSVPAKLSKLAIGKKVSVRGNFSYPINVPDGSYYLFAAINTSGAITESNPSNDSIGGLAPVTIQAPRVDVGLSITTLPGTIATGPKGKNALAFSLANSGNVVAKGTAILQLYASSDATFDPSDTLLSSTKISLNLAAGKSVLSKVALKLAAGAVTGAKYIYAVITPTTTVADTDTANNSAFSAVPVTFN
jgi:parallel beta-helix repeat protein